MTAVMTPAFRRMARITVAISRASNALTGAQSSPASVYTGVRATPIDPVSGQVAQRAGLETPYTAWQCAVAGTYDIRRGDTLEDEASGDTYTVREVLDYPEAFGAHTLMLVLEGDT